MHNHLDLKKYRRYSQTLHCK